jgi:putative drug exporter of the RND superfamily
MTGPLYRLGRFCSRRWPIVLIVWLFVFVGLAFWAGTAGQDTNDNLTLPGTDSQNATDLLEDKFPEQANGTNPLVLKAPEGKKLKDDPYAKAVDDTIDNLKKNPDVQDAISPFSSEGADQLSKGGEIGYIAVNVKPSPTELTEDQADDIIDDADPARAAGLEVAMGGYVGQKVSKTDTEWSEAVGLTMAVIVLLITFGTVVAMGLPIVTAIVGLVSGLSIITLLGHVIEVPSVAPTLATMIGLGVGIDYALFIVTRHRSQIAEEGMDYPESIARATATSGGAVVFAGSTVMVALLSLGIVDLPLVTALGYTSALTVAVAVVAAITLLPALLGMLGPRIEKLRIPLPKHMHHDAKPHGWLRWATFVAKRPWPSLIVATVILLALAYPATKMWLGQQDNGNLPEDTQARQSYDLLSEGFGPGVNGQMLVSVDLSEQPAKPDQDKLNDIDKQEKQQKDEATQKADEQEQQLEAQGVPPDQAQEQVQPQLDEQLDEITQQADDQKQQVDQPASDPRLQTLRDDMSKTKGVEDVTQPLVNDEGTAAVYTVTPTTAPSDKATIDTVNRLRDDTIPEATKGQGMTAYVGGTTAGYIDLASQISSKLPQTIITVILLSFILLLLAFRSVLIPLTAGLMNLISIGAAFGVVTAVFEQGHGEQLVGLDAPVPIVSYVPLFMFAILFGLSMDYEVFLMTHIRERWAEAKENHTSVVEGLAHTGRVITSAALIMVSVFCAFILSGDPTVKQFGVGMAVAVAVDATVVRCLLVPAVMILLGKANWWMPRWLDRILPDFSIEGEEYFRELDAKRAAEPIVAKPDGEGLPGDDTPAPEEREPVA